MHRVLTLSSRSVLKRHTRVGSYCFYFSSSSKDDDEEEHRPIRRYMRADSEMLVMEVDDALGGKKNELLEMLQREQMVAAKQRVPWFLEKMPKAYFKQVDKDLRDQHLSALVALHDFGGVPELTLNSSDGSTLTKISSKKERGGGSLLYKQLNEIRADDKELSGLSIFSSLDDEISLSIFKFEQHDAQQEKAEMTKELSDYLDQLNRGEFGDDPLHPKPGAHYFDKEYLQRFIEENCRQDYISHSSPRRFCKQIQLYHDIMKNGMDEVGIDIEQNWNGDPSQWMITIGVTNVEAIPAMKRLTQYFASKGIDIVRTHLDLIGSDDNVMSMFRILVTKNDEKSNIQEMMRDLGTISKWIDDRSLELIEQDHDNLLSAMDAQVIIALCDLCHAILAPKDPFEYARTNIENIVKDGQRFEYTLDILKLFHQRFDPARQGEKPVVNAAELKERIRESGELKSAQVVLETMIDVVENTVRTNAFVPNRFGISFRLNPEICVQHLIDEDHRTECPYGIYFVHGRRFAGFHVRFRDIARGGLRVVTPRNLEMHGVESARQLTECYDLAFAQQLKNKDIAEGGAKAVCLIDMSSIASVDRRDHIIRKSLKAMVNSILDLLLLDDNNKVDYLQKDEFIYFGPDEQVTPEHINWIVQRAEERNYSMPSAFMSSKPDAGINHKVYGVTSEGVAVFLDHALDFINKKDGFTIKITGGPDGDVAGNMLKILNREYGEKAKVVGLADGTASLEDPDGIAWDELLRLVHSNLPLNKVQTDKLGPRGKLYLCDTPDGIHKRNTMHNRVRADAFVPAGGRPATINDSNWSKFLESKTPLIVEGANLFLTPIARQKLSENGVIIVKDSSANKCGVICSAFEIIASMMLSKEEFLEIKPVFVEQVLDLLKHKANMEATLMFSNPKYDYQLSQQISKVINQYTDTIAADKQTDLDIIQQNLPPILVEKFWPRYLENVPPNYQQYHAASLIASQIVYQEGTDYDCPDVLKYVEIQRKWNKLDPELAQQILRKGAAYIALKHNLL